MSPIPQTAVRLGEAREHAKAGRLQDAERAFRSVLADNPTSTEALRFVANAALAHGNPGEAVDLLNRAADSNRSDPDILLELGAAYRAGERYDAARYVLERAITIRGGRNPVARLLLGSVLESDRREELATLHYFRSILEAQAASRWLNDSTTEPGLRGLVRHAMRFIAGQRRSAYDNKLATLRSQHPAADFARVDRGLATYLRESTERPADPAQKPTFLWIPELETSRFPDPAKMDWLSACVSMVCKLDAELAACAEAHPAAAPAMFSLENMTRTAPVTSRDTPQMRDRTPVYQRGLLSEQARLHAPKLLTAIEAAPLIWIPGNGPDAEIISLDAGRSLETRFGRSNARLVAVIASSSSANNDVIIGGERRILRAGEMLVFDPSFGYQYTNTGGGLSRIVAFEFWHPDLTYAERDAIRVVTETAVEFDAKLQELT